LILYQIGIITFYINYKPKGGDMQDCIFCKIINREIKADIVFENENVIAFNDISPKAPIHILVIPKKHIDGFFGSQENLEDISNIWRAINEIVEIVGIKDAGFRIIMNSGKDGGQEVSHLHFHVLGGKKLSFPEL
jgi:histidine triad (HIT) family protein